MTHPPGAPEDVWTSHGFRIVHHVTASNRPGGCQYHTTHGRRVQVSDGPIDWYVGLDGLNSLLEILSRPGAAQAEVVRIIQRIHLPGYERARLHARDAAAARARVAFWRRKLEPIVEPVSRPSGPAPLTEAEKAAVNDVTLRRARDQLEKRKDRALRSDPVAPTEAQKKKADLALARAGFRVLEAPDRKHGSRKRRQVVIPPKPEELPKELGRPDDPRLSDALAHGMKAQERKAKPKRAVNTSPVPRPSDERLADVSDTARDRLDTFLDANPHKVVSRPRE